MVNVDHWRISAKQKVRPPLRHTAKPTGGIVDLGKCKAEKKRTIRRKASKKSVIGAPFSFSDALKSVEN